MDFAKHLCPVLSEQKDRSKDAESSLGQRFSSYFAISGKKVLVLNGGYRGNEGILESINEKSFCATIIIDSVSTVSHNGTYLLRRIFHL